MVGARSTITRNGLLQYVICARNCDYISSKKTKQVKTDCWHVWGRRSKRCCPQPTANWCASRTRMYTILIKIHFTNQSFAHVFFLLLTKCLIYISWWYMITYRRANSFNDWRFLRHKLLRNHRTISHHRNPDCLAAEPTAIQNARYVSFVNILWCSYQSITQTEKHQKLNSEVNIHLCVSYLSAIFVVSLGVNICVNIINSWYWAVCLLLLCKFIA